ncbi:MAG: FAD-dependent oxidoreductase [Planctomycetota bacterium]
MADRVETREVDVLVVGGGCSGAAAAIQAARMGARVLVVEETPWLGGMLTAAGVSAVDGNEGPLGGGLFGAFRGAMEDHYGGPEAVRTGWVSNTCFEPEVAAAWFAREVAASGAEVLHGASPERIRRAGDRVTGALFDRGEEWMEVHANVAIDATEYGDVLHLGGVPYRLGRESSEETGEPHAASAPDDEIQDLTMVATLRRFDGEAPRVALPLGFDLGRFDCSTAVRCEIPDPGHWNHALHDWDSFLGYALLPGGRFMLNWPFHANDHPAQGLFGTREERARTIARAKERALAYVHYVQTALGHPEWGLATDVYPTDDGLPLLPYVRESRRVVPVRWLREQDVVPQEGSGRNAVLGDGVAVGDYYLDHHHDKDHRPPGERLGEDYPANAPFQVPYSALVPRAVDGLLAAEKNIGATHIVNGCSRLQPVSMLIGQAAGAAAALAASEDVAPRSVDVARLQDVLLDAGCQLVPDRELAAGDAGFAERQRALLGRSPGA